MSEDKVPLPSGGFLEVNAAKCGGCPVLKGTRFTLAQLLAELAEGRNLWELAEDFDLDCSVLQGSLNSLAFWFSQANFSIET